MHEVCITKWITHAHGRSKSGTSDRSRDKNNSIRNRVCVCVCVINCYNTINTIVPTSVIRLLDTCSIIY